MRRRQSRDDTDRKQDHRTDAAHHCRDVNYRGREDSYGPGHAETLREHVETLRRLSLSVPGVTLRRVELLWLDRALRRFARAATTHDRKAGEEIAQLPSLIDELPAYVAANTLARAALKWSRELRPEDLGWTYDQEIVPCHPRVTLTEYALALSRALDGPGRTRERGVRQPHQPGGGFFQASQYAMCSIGWRFASPHRPRAYARAVPSSE